MEESSDFCEFSSPMPAGGDLESLDSMLCFSRSKVVCSGIKETDFQDEYLVFVNAGGTELQGRDLRLICKGDSFFEGGDVIKTNNAILEGGDYPSLYQSVRYGNFCYNFDGLDPGVYLVDFHFAEIVYTNGPKGIRVFDVFVQDEKVLSELDIFSIIGSNKPLRITEVNTSVSKDGLLKVRFERISGSPVVCGIGIRKALRDESQQKAEPYRCSNCAAELPVSPTQARGRQMRVVAKLEKKIEELTSQCKSKNDECHEAWMLLDATNEQLQKLTMDFSSKLIHNDNLEEAVRKQMDELSVVSERYETDKKIWAAGLNDLERKLRAFKQEHAQLSLDAHRCANSVPNLNKMITTVQALVAQSEELKTKYHDEVVKRKKLYNQLQETKGNIRVFCRCRPLSKEELSSGCSTTLDFEAAKDGELGVMATGSTKKTFKFDRVFTPKDNQEDVFLDASPLVTSVLDGYNVCIFAYGQTGTGKTFTMEGTERNRGVNYRTLEELFRIAEERKDAITYTICVSVLEVYNEQIRDLLATTPSSKKLEIRQAPEGSHHVPGIVEANVTNITEVWDVLQAGSSARAVGSNNVNEHSSRSHCMLCVIVKSKNLINGECTKSKLWLVDLAGSERLAKTDVQGERLKEAQNINRSLSALGDVISALATKSSHVPFRNSKLTHLLQDSLGGDSKALMFVQISPSDSDLGETLSSLNFATRVRGVELGPAKKQIDTGELQKMKQLLDKVRQELRIKEESLRKLEDASQSLENRLKGKDQLCKDLQEKNNGLERQLESKVELQSLSEKQHWQLAEKLRGKDEACANLQQKVEELEFKLKELQTESNQKVKDLESKLKEQKQLGQKVIELEKKLKDKEQSESMVLLCSAEASRQGTPANIPVISGREHTESIGIAECHILQSSNSINRQPAAPASILLRGPEPLQEIKKKRELQSRMNEEHENYYITTPAIPVKKSPLIEIGRVRKIDPTKALGRLTRTTKVVHTRRTSLHTKTVKEHQAGGKARGWL